MELEKIIMNLILAINNEDLTTTMECVALLDNFNPYPVTMISNMLSLHPADMNYSNYLSNKCIDYVLDNLLINSKDEIKLMRKKESLLLEKDIDKIELFLTQELHNNTFKAVHPRTYIQTLIELAV